MKDNMKWLCENAGALEKFSGRWVIFSCEKGVVGSGASLPKALKSCPKPAGKPFVFHVPSKKELDTPVFVAHKK